MTPYEFAKERHGSQMYGELSYVEGHLAKVVAKLQKSGFTSAEMKAAGWLHDVVEDTETPIEEIEARFGKKIAELVWAVTCEKSVGKTRRERLPHTYRKIQGAGLEATALKLADRIQNVESCWDARDSRLFMYQKEYREFRLALFSDEDGSEILALWKELDQLLGWWEK